jgi:hypothetical protein
VAAAKARNRSTKSGFIGLSSNHPPLLDGQTPGLHDAFRRRHPTPVVGVMAVGLGVGREADAR